MKTNNIIRLSAILVILLGLIFTGCSKKSTTETTNTSTSSLQQLTSDENIVENNSDEAMNDANAVLSPGGLKSTEMLPCNATIDSTPVHNDTIVIYIHYHGLTCDNKKFITGDIQVSRNVNTHWYDAGATVLVKFINFKVVRVATQKSMTFNGTKTFVNVSGGFIWQLGYQIQALIHRVTGSIQVTFDDNSTKTWNIARERILTRVIDTANNAAHLLLTINGLGSADGYDNLVVWGVNRNNENFYSQITESVIIKEACSWDPCCGVEEFQIPATHKSATITFGYDSNNNLIPCGSTDCPTRYRVDWTINNQSGTFFLPLH